MAYAIAGAWFGFPTDSDSGADDSALKMSNVVSIPATLPSSPMTGMQFTADRDM